MGGLHSGTAHEIQPRHSGETETFLTMALSLDTIKDPKVRKRIEDADAEQNRSAPINCIAKASPAPSKPAKRLRQDTKPLMNQLELEFLEHLCRRIPTFPPIRVQAKRYRLGNGIWYKPDFTCADWPDPKRVLRETAWEVKGPKSFRGGFENLKVAASVYPEVRWLLVWKDKTTGEWKEQPILP